MQLGCIMHRASESACYAIDENTIEIKLKTGYDVDEVNIIYGDPFSGGILGGDWKWSGEKLQIKEVYELSYHKLWVVQITPPYKRLKYYFELKNSEESILFFEDGFMSCEEAQLSGKVLQCFTMPWLNSIDVAKTPKWARDTIWYQIFPDRFCRGDFENNKDALPWNSKVPDNADIYGGDLAGIIKKLDYIKSIGITGIYLNPIFEALATHKYDTTNYYEIDKMFGDKEVFSKFVLECHKRDIKVMLDGVFNHCGTEFAQWKDVVEKGEQSPYFNWFMINEWPIDETKYHTKDKEFYSFAFTAHMPKLNTNNPEVIEYIVKICEYWISEFDIDGWRLDVANEISHALCKEINKRCIAIKPDIYILGEIWHDSINWLLGDEFHSVMNYPLTTVIDDFWINKKMTAKQFLHGINNCYHRYMHQTNAVLFNLLDSHDTARLYSKVHQNLDVFYQQLTILFTMAGSTSIYYGTEIAMDGAHDPLCRGCMPWDEIEGGMHDEKIAKMQALTYMRNTNKACKSEKITFLYNYNDRVIEYLKDGSLKVIINASDESINYKTPKNSILFQNKCSIDTILPGGAIVYKI